MFPTFSCFLPFSLVPHTTILSETRSACPIVSFPLVFFLSSDPQKAFASDYMTIYYDKLDCFIGILQRFQTNENCRMCNTILLATDKRPRLDYSIKIENISSTISVADGGPYS